MTRTTTYSSGGTPIFLEIFDPSGTARGGAVVIAHGSDGVVNNSHGPWATMMRGYGEDIARAGFTALLPHYFEKTGTDPGLPAMQSMAAHLGQWQDALGDAITSAASARVALVGFSLGGHLSLRLRSRAQVVVEFFAPFAGGLGAGPGTHVQIHHGTGDTVVNIADADQIADALRAERVTPEIYRYPDAGHGFAGADAANVDAQRLSKERTLRFLNDHL